MTARECDGDAVALAIDGNPSGVAEQYLERDGSIAATACVLAEPDSLTIGVPETRWDTATGTVFRLEDARSFYVGTVSDGEYFFASTLRGPAGNRLLVCRILELFVPGHAEEAGSWTALEGGSVPGVAEDEPLVSGPSVRFSITSVVGEPARSLIGDQTVASLEIGGAKLGVAVPGSSWGEQAADLPEGAEFYVGYLERGLMFLGFVTRPPGNRFFECYIVPETGMLSHWTAVGDPRPQ